MLTVKRLASLLYKELQADTYGLIEQEAFGEIAEQADGNRELTEVDPDISDVENLARILQRVVDQINPKPQKPPKKRPLTKHPFNDPTP